MKKYTIILPIVLFIASCTPELQSKHLTYKNIAIVSDLSSRLRNNQQPQEDISEIQRIIQFFKKECVKPGEKIGDKSSISFSTFSAQEILSIDLEKIKNLGDKQSFINSTGKFKSLGLDSELVNFEKQVKSIYRNVSNPGLDLISLLIEKVDNQDIIKTGKYISDGIDTTYINYDNEVYIFTDGYLEYNSSNKQKNSQYYFGNAEIEKVRKFCQTHKVDVITALKNNDSLGLPLAKGKKNGFINLHILETAERDKDAKFNTYKYPKDLRDNEILEAVWRKWAKDSGFKSLEWKKS